MALRWLLVIGLLAGCKPPHPAGDGGTVHDMAPGADLRPVSLPDAGVLQALDHWPKQVGSDGDDRVLAMVTDASGNLYVAGNFSGALPVEWGGTKSFGGRDVVVAKIAPAGHLVWVRTMGGSGHDLALGLALGPEGDVFVTGAFEFSADFGGPAFLESAGSFDVFLARLRGSDGQPLWNQRVGGGPYRDVGYGVAVSPMGDVYVVGRFYGQADVAGAMLTSAGDWDAFIADYDESGKVKWVHQAGGPGDDFFAAVTTLSNGDAVVVGDVTAKNGWTIAFDGMTLSGHGTIENHDATAARYGRDGTIAWVTSSPDDYSGDANAVANDGSDGIVVAGWAQGNLVFGLTTNEYGWSYAARLGSDGKPASVLPLAIVRNTDPTKPGADIHAAALAVASGGVVVGGAFTQQIRYQSPNVPPTPPPVDYATFAMAGYVATATATAKQGFVPFFAGDDTHVDAVTAAPDGTLYAAVTFSGTLQLADGNITAVGGADSAIVKLVYPTAPAVVTTPTETPSPQPQAGTSKCVPPPASPKPGSVAGMPTFKTMPVVLPKYQIDFVQGTAIDLKGRDAPDIFLDFANCGRCNGFKYGGPLFVLGDPMGMLVDETKVILQGPIDYWSTSNPPFIATDLDGDGLSDLFAGQSAYDVYPWYGDLPIALMQQPDGTLRDESAERIPIDPRELDPTTYAFTHYFDVADIDCSGHPAAFLSNITSTRQVFPSRLLLNDGAGRFVIDQRTRLDPALFADNAADGPFTAGLFCDVNRDGAPDLVLGANANKQGQTSVLLLNDGFGHFIAKPNAFPAPPFNESDGGTIIYWVCVDVNQDGWNDLVFHDTLGYTKEQIALWLNKGDGTFSATADSTIPEPVYGKPIYAVDLNKDGWPDLVGAGTGNQFIALNKGDGTFEDASALLPMVKSFSYSILPLDVNRDGKQDLFVFYSDTPTANLLLNTTP